MPGFLDDSGASMYDVKARLLKLPKGIRRLVTWKFSYKRGSRSATLPSNSGMARNGKPSLR